MSGFDILFGTGEPAPEHVAWCRRQIDMLNLGGAWAIPRSGLIFTKTGDNEFTLTARMPWSAEMEGTITAEQLAEQQQEEYDVNRRYFAAAGVTLKDATVPEREES